VTSFGVKRSAKDSAATIFRPDEGGMAFMGRLNGEWRHVRACNAKLPEKE
jgi:hypothetical protein